MTARHAHCGVCREHPCLCDPTQTAIVIRHGDGTETLVRIFGQHVDPFDVSVDVKPVGQRSWSPAGRDTWELRCE